LNKEAAALATEPGSVKQALHLEREASCKQATKVEQLQAVEARAASLDAQLAHSRTPFAQAVEPNDASPDAFPGSGWKQICETGADSGI